MSYRPEKHIDCSIIIPTFNRSEFVRIAIASALRQTGVRFEILVIDDGSTDDTARVVKRFRDKRVRYIKNKKRIWSSMNVRKCMLLSFGKYIFTLGDDDFFLSEHTISRVLNVMKKNHLGMARVGKIMYEKSMYEPYQLSVLGNTLKVYKPEKYPDILTRTINFGLNGFCGLAFDNTRIAKKTLKQDHICKPNHLCFPYHRTAYDLITKHGIAYVPDYLICTHLSLELIPKFFDMKKHGRLFMEQTLEKAKEYLADNEFIKFQKSFLLQNAAMLPSIKYFTSYYNLIRVIQRMITLDPSLRMEPRFILWSFFGFLPNSVIAGLRDIKMLQMKKQVFAAMRSLEYKKQVEKIIIIAGK